MRILFFALLMSFAPLAPAAGTPGIDWLRSEHDAFERAKKEQRFVLLYLEAVWCHWCHVMDHDTYGNAGVRALVDAHYVPLRIDQDARPDLSARYQDYGWPATIVFAADGTEIVKRQGFIEPESFERLLKAIVEDPSPERLAASAAAAPAPGSSLSDDVRGRLLQRHRDTFDPELGGLRQATKSMDRDSVEYSLALAQAGDAVERAQAIRTLDAARALIDPVWGGVYQYSARFDWKHPHFEKLGTLQGEYLRVYAQAYALTGDADYLDAARRIRHYVDGFLASPDGGYYASQDADLEPGVHSGDFFSLDDAARRKRGMPRIDTHRYARETGLIAEGLLALHEATGDAKALVDARRAIAWAIAERGLPGGGFRHDAKDSGGPYLADTLAMGRALLALYRASGEREWLDRAARAMDFVETRFRSRAGYVGAAASSPIAAVASIDDNIALARHANLLSRYTGSDAHRGTARHALAWLAQPDVALSRLTDIGIVLADRELNSDPLHLTVVGGKRDPDAAALHAACLRLASGYKRLDWWDRAEGPLPNPDVNYPPVKTAAAFVCTERRCSLPIRQPAEIAAFVAEGATTP